MNSDLRPRPTTYAAIVFKGDDLDLDLVSTVMGTAPTLAYRRGEAHTSKGAAHARRFGLWVYSTRNIVESARLADHLEVLEGLMIGPVAAGPDRRHRRLREIRSLVRGGKAELRVDVFWHGSHHAEQPRVSLSFDTIVRMAGGRVETDIHREGEDIQAA